MCYMEVNDTFFFNPWRIVKSSASTTVADTQQSAGEYRMIGKWSVYRRVRVEVEYTVQPKILQLLVIITLNAITFFQLAAAKETDNFFVNVTTTEEAALLTSMKLEQTTSFTQGPQVSSLPTHSSDGGRRLAPSPGVLAGSISAALVVFVFMICVTVICCIKQRKKQPKPIAFSNPMNGVPNILPFPEASDTFYNEVIDVNPVNLVGMDHIDAVLPVCSTTETKVTQPPSNDQEKDLQPRKGTLSTFGYK